METAIKIEQLTKDYGEDRGIFDLNLTINKGEVFGLVGTNGSGKTTTLRALMGFIKPTSGKATINGLNTWKKAANLKKYIGYVPGEIAFPDTKTGNTFLKMQAELLKVKETKTPNRLIKELKLDTAANIRRMSKGMKQKTALVDAFMSQPDILLLDEPTTGLDPVMRDVFIDWVKEVKKNGKTVVMSSHMFNELEPTCDRIAFIKDGKIVEVLDQKKIAKLKDYQVITIQFSDSASFTSFLQQKFAITQIEREKKLIRMTIKNEELPALLKQLAEFQLKDISFSEQGLDAYFQKKLQSEAF